MKKKFLFALCLMAVGCSNSRNGTDRNDRTVGSPRPRQGSSFNQGFVSQASHNPQHCTQINSQYTTSRGETVSLRTERIRNGVRLWIDDKPAVFDGGRTPAIPGNSDVTYAGFCEPGRLVMLGYDKNDEPQVTAVIAVRPNGDVSVETNVQNAQFTEFNQSRVYRVQR